MYLQMTSAAFMTRDEDLLVMTTKFVKQLTEANRFTGPALVPYYRQILPYFNQYYKKNKNTADKFEYDQRYQFNLGDVIAETLEALEKTGGPVLSAHRERSNPYQEHGTHL
jgi:Parkin co-regulated protein